MVLPKESTEKLLLVVLTALIIVTFLFHPLTSYFSQDDFFHLRIVMGKSIPDLLFLISPNSKFVHSFYRPISRELYNFFTFRLFHLSPLPYHLINLTFILVNGYLTYIFIGTITKQKIVATLSYLIYLMSAVHSVELYYLSSIQTLLAGFFMLLCLLEYNLYLLKPIKKLFLLSLLFFILALGCHESAVTLFPIILILTFIHISPLELNNFRRIFSVLIPFLLVLLIRGGVYFLSAGLPEEAAYRPVVSVKTMLNTFSWLSIWSLGISEILPDFVSPGFNLNKNFIKWYSWYSGVVFPLVGVSLLILLISLLSFRKQIFKNKIFWFFISSYVFSEVPFLFFPQHKFVYYLSFPIVWLSATLSFILSFLLNKKNLSFILIIYLFSFATVNFFTINLNSQTYWAAKRDKAAESLLFNLKKVYPNIQNDSIFFIKDDPTYPFISKEWGTSSQQAFLVLSGSDAIQLLYNNPTIKVYYQSKGDVNQNKISVKTLDVIARFPY